MKWEILEIKREVEWIQQLSCKKYRVAVGFILSEPNTPKIVKHLPETASNKLKKCSDYTKIIQSNQKNGNPYIFQDGSWNNKTRITEGGNTLKPDGFPPDSPPKLESFLNVHFDPLEALEITAEINGVFSQFQLWIMGGWGRVS